MPEAKPTVAIIYGFAEGPPIGRAFCKALKRSGFELTNNAVTADIVIGHSGGCYMVPKNTKATLVVLIGLPHWPGKGIMPAIGRKMWREVRAHRQQHDMRTLLTKTWWNFVYAWNIPRNIAMWYGRQQGWVWRLQCKTMLVRPQHDTMCVIDAAHLPFTHHPTLVSMPGLHDDCWRFPHQYVDAIQSVYK